MTSGRVVLFVISHVGDYHAARLRALDQRLRARGDRLVVLELAGRSAFYAHTQNRAAALLDDVDVRRAAATSLTGRVSAIALAVRNERPDFVLQLGHNGAVAATGLAAARLASARIVFLSDSKADDQPRSTWRELVKAAVVRRFDGAVVAGERHRAYFASLGLPRERIETGYDVIDNSFFAARAAAFRRKRSLVRRLDLVPDRYVLVVSRLVERKRVPLALELYALSGLPQAGVDLVLVGDGPERARVDEAIARLGIGAHVRRRPSVKNSVMPLFYAFAEALVLASEYDQWGLCVNEAMAAGVPALVTRRCGCAGEIVIDGVNGVVWDGADMTAGAASLRRLALDYETRRRFSAAAVETMRDWDVTRFAGAVTAVMDRTLRGRR